MFTKNSMFDARKFVYHINYGEEDEMEMFGYRPSLCRKIITWVLITFTGFLLRLIFSWRPHWMLYATHVRCRSDEATKVLLIDRYSQHFVESIEDELNQDGKRFRYFENKKLRYIWDDTRSAFVKLHGLDQNTTLDVLFGMFDGLTHEEQACRRHLYGNNSITVEVESYLRILFQEVLGPFYIFQVFSIAIWFIDDYQYYGTCIIIMSVLSLVSGVVQIRRNQEQLRATVDTSDCVKVCRANGQCEEVESSKLVPGDVVVVPTFDTILQFDAILINGNVIVNESMLTGESVPITKTPISANNLSVHSGQYYDPKEHGKHTLYCGTRVLQTRHYNAKPVKALIIRCGYQTAKGELIRSIMFPKPVDFRFNRQINRFIGLLGCVALLGFTYTVVIKTQRGASLSSIVLSALDLITVVVPPALPAAMTIGVIYAQSRLKKNKIYCISPRSINICGSINCVCFDKTGTLTEDHLSFNEVVTVDEETFDFGPTLDETDMADVLYKCPAKPYQISTQQSQKNALRSHETGQFSPLMSCLASCHSLTIIDGKLVGDPLDLQMFEATGWRLEEPDGGASDQLAAAVVKPPCCAPVEPQSSDNRQMIETSDDGFLELASECDEHEIGLLRQFTFSSSLQRMSVVTRRCRSNRISPFVVFTKGAPEKIAALCDPETIPDDFSEVLVKYTRRGYRVLGLAYRELPPDLSYAQMQRATRTDLEADLKFLGLLTLGNLLKPETTNVIKTLNSANIRSVMVTGDNMLTALSVACDCHLISRHDKIVLLQVQKAHGKQRRRANAGDKSMMQNSANTIVEITMTASSTNTLPNEEVSPAHSQAALSDSDITGSDTDSDFLASKAAKPKLTWHYVTNVCSDDEDDDEDQHQKPIEGACVVKMPPPPLKNGDQSSRYHVAVTGDTWDVIRNYYPELMDRVCVRGTVFARMSPEQKQQLVEHLQSLQYYVGMCGDGANDSGALRSAHAGISLSDTEASVAAPFTSAVGNISCIPILICEGRAALVTAFGILKYMALYSLIQFCSVIILRALYTSLTDMQFLYVDLFIIALFVALFGRTEPHPSLAKVPPSSSLMSLTQLSSVSIQLVLVIAFQLLGGLVLWQQPWYQSHEPQYDNELAGHDNCAIFGVSVFQYITLAIVFSKGKPYRRSIWSNIWFLAALIIVTGTTIILFLVPPKWAAYVPFITLDVVEDIPLSFKCLILAIAFAHFLVSMFGERFIVDHLIFSKSQKQLEASGSKQNGAYFEQVKRQSHGVEWLKDVTSEKIS